MARRRRNRSGQFTASGSRTRTITRTVRAPAPIIRVSSPRVAAPPRRRRAGRVRRAVGSALARAGSRTALALGSAALGYAHKEKWLEKLPVIGKAGPITSFALLGWGAEEIGKVKLPNIVHDAITAALCISAFNLGFSSGETIVGDSYGYPGGAVFFE